MKASHSDALVLFGVTGDLAHKMIFPALYAMVKRGTLTVPVIGVALPKWSLARLHKRVTEGIGRSGGVDNQPALRHLLSLLKYVSGDYDHPKTFTAIKSALGRARRPAHYLAIPPSLFEMVIKGLGAADLAAHARVIVEKPFGRDLASARERWGCHHDSGRVSFRISNAQREVERVPTPELVQVGYLPADFGQQDWRRVSRQKRLTVSARQTAMPFRSLCPLRTKSSSCRQ